MCHNDGMNVKKFLVRFLATVSSTALAAAGTSQIFDVAFWKTFSLAVIAATLPIVKKLLDASKDGDLTAQEAEEALKGDQ
jgi:hypothetical protein